MNESVLREAFVSTPVTFIQTRFHVHAAVTSEQEGGVSFPHFCRRCVCDAVFVLGAFAFFAVALTPSALSGLVLLDEL